MFKTLALQASHNLSDERTEYLIRDQLSFMGFLGLGLFDTVPDANTIWIFREALTRARIVGDLPDALNERYKTEICIIHLARVNPFTCDEAASVPKYCSFDKGAPASAATQRAKLAGRITQGSANERRDIMAQVVANLNTIDLRQAEVQVVTGKDVKTLQALLNLFLPAGDAGEDGSPIPPLMLDGAAGAKTKQGLLAFQTTAHLATDAVVGPLTWRKLIEQDF
jgi:peptidoglycan hydrolase-like protein with peptidoglycan-binding domain